MFTCQLMWSGNGFEPGSCIHGFILYRECIGGGRGLNSHSIFKKQRLKDIKAHLKLIFLGIQL